MKEHGFETFFFEVFAKDFIEKLIDCGIPFDVERELNYDLGFPCNVTIVHW